MSPWLLAAALLGAAGVTLGAFGAHGLRAHVTPEQLSSWKTAVEYHLLHSVALLALALYGSAAGREVGLTAGLWTTGILLFAGSIYGLVLDGPRWLGPVTPLGGLCLIAGWLSLLLLLRR